MSLSRQGSFMPKLLSRRRNRAAAKIQAAWRKKKSKPSRLFSGKKTYNQTRRITNTVMRNISESKYQGARKDCLQTVAKPLGTIRPMSYIFLNTGASIATQHPEFGTPLNLFQFPQGTNGDQRVGEYMYVRHTHLKMEVSCLPSNPVPTSLDPYLNAPVRCRLMVVKANRKNNRYGKSPSPGASLFIDTQNGGFGYNETTGSINLLMKQPINKRKWIVYKDTSFTLTPVAIQSNAQGGQVYNPGRGRACYRTSMKLPVYKKTHFDNSTNTPDDIDTQWLIILQCARETHCFGGDEVTQVRPQQIRMELLGTTSALDN